MERNVAAASAAVFLVGSGEEFWKQFLAKCLKPLDAGVAVVRLFSTSEDFLDAVYQYPSDWLVDRWGRRCAPLMFLVAALAGYLIYLFSQSWPFLFVGLAFAMAWQSMASPAIFVTIGDALPKEMRAMGFTVQSMPKRIPMVISPLGGALIGALGFQRGIRSGFIVTTALVGITIPVFSTISVSLAPRDSVRLLGVCNSFHSTLKRPLVSAIAIRRCEGLADIFVVLYVTNITGVTIPRYGIVGTLLFMATAKEKYEF